MGAAFSAGPMTRSWSGPCWICVRMPWALYLWRCVVKHSTAPRGMCSLSPCPWIRVAHCALPHASLYIESHPTWCLIGFCISLALKICKYLSHLTLKPFGLDEMLHFFPQRDSHMSHPALAGLKTISDWLCLFDHHLHPTDIRERQDIRCML